MGAGIDAIGLARIGHLHRLVDIADAAQVALTGVVEVHVEAVQAQVQGVVDRAGAEPLAGPEGGGLHVFIAAEGARYQGEVAVVLGVLHAMAQEIVVAFARAISGVKHQ
ncbi:hypothetical protein D3C81_1734320 [compost metagenome]